MTFRDRRRVVLLLALAVIASFGAGIGYWVAAGQHHAICDDGRPPLQQQDSGLGQIVYRCHNGQIVTGSILP